MVREESKMAEQASEKVGLAEVLDVAENGAIPVTGLDRDMGQFDQIVKCERCNGILRTAFAKQCLHCGYDWHS